jgi:hypothetical protein
MHVAMDFAAVCTLTDKEKPFHDTLPTGFVVI